jgi:hypothetical protein
VKINTLSRGDSKGHSIKYTTSHDLNETPPPPNTPSHSIPSDTSVVSQPLKQAAFDDHLPIYLHLINNPEPWASPW